MNIGANIWGSTDEAVFSARLDVLISKGFDTVRIDIPNWADVATLARSKACVLIANSKGLKTIWGVSQNPNAPSGVVLTAANKAAFYAAIEDAAEWAQQNGVWAFQEFNEEELHNDDTTLTDAQLRADLKAEATICQTKFTNGNIIGGINADTVDHGTDGGWLGIGRGDIDVMGLLQYGNDTAYYPALMKTMMTAFGADHFQLMEFNIHWSALTSYSTDEELQKNRLQQMISDFEDIGIELAMFFTYVDNNFGAISYAGAYRKIWDILSVYNLTNSRLKDSGISGILSQIQTTPNLWLAAGTGSPSSTALGSEISRVPVTSRSISGKVLTLSASLPAGIATNTITELGLFNAASGGNMWASKEALSSDDFLAAIVKGSNDSLTINLNITGS